MKRILCMTILILGSVAAFGQGRLLVANNGATQLTNIAGAATPLVGDTSVKIGIYWGTNGAWQRLPDSEYGAATTWTSPGVFNRGIATFPVPAGTRISVQVRAWNSAFISYEQAIIGTAGLGLFVQGSEQLITLGSAAAASLTNPTGAGDTPFRPFAIKIGDVPSIMLQPDDRGAVVGSTTTFGVSVWGDLLSYQWYHGAIAIPNATNSAFTITNITLADAGGYSVVVSNPLGSATSRVAQLTVSYLQIKTYAGLTILGTVGKTYRIDSTPEGTVNWRFVTNINLPRTPFIWIDYDSPNASSRLYRTTPLP